ncbi:hypothetical protein FOXYSP1_20770 [Fusarium oxysporum f. sp. phaseoli]
MDLFSKRASQCEYAYEANPDIAGRGIVNSLIIHAAIYLVIGMMIAPFVHFFFRQITPAKSRINAAELGSHYAKALEARETLARSDTRHFVVSSFCSSQYVITLSLVVVAFVKHHEISYYHLRIIHSMASLNFGSACICAYNYTAIDHYKDADTSEDVSEVGSEDGSVRTSSPRERPILRRKWSIKDLRNLFEHLTLYLSVLSYVVYSVWVATKTIDQANYRHCFPRDQYYFNISIGICSLASIASGLFPFARLIKGFLGQHPAFLRLRSFRWVSTTLLSIISLVFQSIQIYAIQSAFQNQSGSKNSETEYGFGQLLVFFMVFQLVLELLIALHMDFSKLSKEIDELGISDQFQLGWFMRGFAALLATLIKAKLFTVRLNYSEHTSGMPSDEDEEGDESNRHWWSSYLSKLAQVAGRIFSRRPSPLRANTISLESQQHITEMPVISTGASSGNDLFPQSLSRRHTETAPSSEDISLEPIIRTQEYH